MATIDEMISIVQGLIAYNGRVTFTHPDYRKFHDEIIEFIIRNHFETTTAWKTIEQYLLVQSNQFLTNTEATTILQNLEVLKRMSIQKENTADAKKIVCYCNQCKINSKHLILNEFVDKGSDKETGVSWADKYQIIRCDNCSMISFRKDGWFSEYQAFPDEDGSYEELFPDSNENKVETKKYNNLPYSLDEIYEEVIKSYNNNSYILCAVGIRAILEGICSDKKIEKGSVVDKNGQTKNKSNLEGKIYGLEESGIISKSQQEALHQLRFLGNDAVHELASPKKLEIKTALDIIEHMMEDIYELPYKAELLKQKRNAK